LSKFIIFTRLLSGIKATHQQTTPGFAHALPQAATAETLKRMLPATAAHFPLTLSNLGEADALLGASVWVLQQEPGVP
jgi:hypothetical protein